MARMQLSQYLRSAEVRVRFPVPEFLFLRCLVIFACYLGPELDQCHIYYRCRVLLKDTRCKIERTHSFRLTAIFRDLTSTQNNGGLLSNEESGYMCPMCCHAAPASAAYIDSDSGEG